MLEIVLTVVFFVIALIVTTGIAVYQTKKANKFDKELKNIQKDNKELKDKIDSLSQENILIKNPQLVRNLEGHFLKVTVKNIGSVSSQIKKVGLLVFERGTIGIKQGKSIDVLAPNIEKDYMIKILDLKEIYDKWIEEIESIDWSKKVLSAIPLLPKPKELDIFLYRVETVSGKMIDRVDEFNIITSILKNK